MRTIHLLIIAGFIVAFGLGFYIRTLIIQQPEHQQPENHPGQSGIHTNNITGKHMKLGAFSVSLSVKDLQTSKAFYESLGFTHFAGDVSKNYLIMKNEHSLIGLFQGMFEGNILTFNPGWDDNAHNTEHFDDVRVIQQELKRKGFKIAPEADENTSGPASFMITDPDGNVILIDQHR